jgi:HSP20 family protein
MHTTESPVAAARDDVRSATLALAQHAGGACVRRSHPITDPLNERSASMNELRIPDPFDVDPLPLMLRDLWRPWRATDAATERAPQIRLDLSESEQAYAVKAEIPGAKKEDLDIRIDGNQVTITAEVKQDKEEKKDGRVLRRERSYGYTSRSFSLAHDIDQAAADAKYSNGVLELRLPKKAPTGGKRLSVG